MSIAGTFKNGVIVPDVPLSVPDGTRVQVVVPQDQEGAPTLTNLLDLAGCVKGLPPDFAAQHDHYLYGTPKK